MTGIWVFIVVFCSVYTVQPRRNFSYSSTVPEVHQRDKVLCVVIGDSVTLQCCIFGTDGGVVIWYKQPNRKPPRIMSRVYKSSEETFYNEFQNLRFQVDRYSNCSKMTISNIIQSDEAMYYCAITAPYSVFGNGTYLKVKETSKPAPCDNSVVCEPTLHGNSTNMKTEITVSEITRSLHSTVLCLGMALGLCALLILSLAFVLLRRRKCDKMKASLEDSPGTRQVHVQESDTETLNYTALQFSKRKAKDEKWKAGSSDECVYSDVGKKL